MQSNKFAMLPINKDYQQTDCTHRYGMTKTTYTQLTARNVCDWLLHRSSYPTTKPNPKLSPFLHTNYSISNHK